MAWPKSRSTLSEEQEAIAADWAKYFLGTVRTSRFDRISRFDHQFSASSATDGLRTLEIGAGAGTHVPFEPSGDYIALDRSDDLAPEIPRRERLSVVLADCEEGLPWRDNSFDRVLAIHVLEHLYNLPAATREVARVLRPDGLFVVVIPCEGGALYSAGRHFTTKRLFEQRYGVPYDWLIRFDHCNYATEIIELLSQGFRIRRSHFFPLRLHSVNLNLVIGFELTLRDTHNGYSSTIRSNSLSSSRP